MERNHLLALQNMRDYYLHNPAMYWALSLTIAVLLKMPRSSLDAAARLERAMKHT